MWRPNQSSQSTSEGKNTAFEIDNWNSRKTYLFLQSMSWPIAEEVIQTEDRTQIQGKEREILAMSKSLVFISLARKKDGSDVRNKKKRTSF